MVSFMRDIPEVAAALPGTEGRPVAHNDLVNTVIKQLLGDRALARRAGIINPMTCICMEAGGTKLMWTAA